MLIQVLVLSLKENKIYIDNIMGVQRRHNQNLGEYEHYDALTETRIEYNPLTEGSGIFYIFFLNIGSHLATEGVEKAASKAAEAALESGMKKVGEKAGENTSDKICPKQPMGRS